MHCDRTGDSIVSGVATDVIFNFPGKGLHVTNPFVMEPKRPSFSEIITRRVRKIGVDITDTLHKCVDLNGIPVNVKLIIRSIYSEYLE